MSSIALFYNIFTDEKEIRTQLAAASQYSIVQDVDIVNEVCLQYNIPKLKAERALNDPTSVFNKFTLERERIIAFCKLVVAEHLRKPGVLYAGNISLFIPSEVTQVLKVAIFDDKGRRIKRAVREGFTEKSALKLICMHDARAMNLADFLAKKKENTSTLYDPSHYDIVIPIGSSNPHSAVQLIIENYHKPAILESATPTQAVIDMALGAEVEIALVEKGYAPEVKSSNGEVSLLIHKSVTNFTQLSETLTEITKGVDGVKSVAIATGKDYFVSVYRNQEFNLPPKVLLVDDEQEFVQTLSERLNTRNYGSYPVFDGEQALEFLGDETPDVIVLDLKMPGLNGVEVLRKTKEANPGIEIIILTGHGSEDDKKVCMDLGACACLNKPVDINQLTKVIDTAYKKVAAARVAHA